MSSGRAVRTDRSAVLNSCRSDRSTASAVRMASITSDGVTSISRSRNSRQKSMMLRCRSECFALRGVDVTVAGPPLARDELLVDALGDLGRGSTQTVLIQARQL